MHPRVILTLMPGSFEQGFPVILRIEKDEQVIGHLPPAPHLLQLLERWQLDYRQMVLPSSRIKLKPVQVTNISYDRMGDRVARSFNDWLNSGVEKWQKIRDRLQQRLSKTDEILIVIETDDLQLRRLPWHLWNLITEDYTKAEVVLSTPEYQSQKDKIVPGKKRVKILAILGNSTGIDVEKDRSILKQLPYADTTFLVEPQRHSLNNQLWEQQWDILFFAGHSSSPDGYTGQIYINQTDSLSLAELKNALRKAIEGGLQLAIFNSCDGLGLARELADLHIPQVIVMREPVPDVVAQEFLQHFLKTFAAGKSLYLAVREARERLQGLEAQFPCATWLPVICQNPATRSPTWRQLCGQVVKPNLKTVLLTSTLVTVLVVGMRFLGLLQPLELIAFDRLMRIRPDEGVDRRLLIVSITEDDFHLPEQQSRKGSLSDRALALLLQKLEQHHPRAVGLDIYHDYPVNPEEKNLISKMKKDDRFIAICRASEPPEKPGVAPPREIPTARQGFSDFASDADGIIRRHLIAMKPSSTSPCTTPYALSARLAFRYLGDEGISVKYTKTKEKELQIGNVVFPRWRSHMGGYQQLNDRGYQILLNYRSNESPLDIAERVTLKDVLTGKVKPATVKDRIVLIGITTNDSVSDDHLTPYSGARQPQQKMPGVIVHAHMTSQILSAVLDGRPLLWVLPFWGEVLWIWAWSIVGGILVWHVRHVFSLEVLSIATFSVLYGLSFGLLYVYAGWLPLVPATLALISTGGIVIVYKPSLAKVGSARLK